MFQLAGLILGCALVVSAADVNDDLLGAARKGDLAGVKAACEKGASIETTTPYGQTPLYVAAMGGHIDVVEYLLDKGAHTDIKDTFYKQPMLGFVLYKKHYDVAKLLISKGDGKADEELDAVADSEHPELVEAVLTKGKVSQAALDKAYESVLEQKQTATAELLKKAGAHEPAPAVAVDAKVLESYAGTYKSEQLPLDIKVSAKEGKLYLQATGQPEFAPKAKSPTVFEFAPAGLQVEFDAPGAFTLRQGGGTFKFKKAVAQ